MLYEFDGRTPTISSDAYVSDLATVIGDVAIAENCYIGHGAILRGDYGRIEIGPGTAVEEGAIVKLRQIIPDRVVAAGNPASIIRDVSSQDREMWNYGKQLYIDLAAKYLRTGLHCLPADNNVTLGRRP